MTQQGFVTDTYKWYCKALIWALTQHKYEGHYMDTDMNLDYNCSYFILSESLIDLSGNKLTSLIHVPTDQMFVSYIVI